MDEGEDVDQFLTSNGLETYISTFRHHAIRRDVLFDITSEDLLDMGISSLGHRIKLLKLIDTRKRTTAVKSGRKPSFAAPLSAAATETTFESSHSTDTLTPASQEILMLRQRLEVSEKHIRKLGDQVVRLRTDLFRKLKESEPLPTPTGKVTSPGSTPGSHTATLLSKRSPSEGYFSRTNAFPGSVVTSPSGARPSSNVHIFHGHYHPGNSGAGSNMGSSSQSPYSQSPSTHHSMYSLPHSSNANLLITANSSEPFKNFRCGEKDNVAKVLSALLQRKYLEGDISQWRLQIEYGDKARELLDHEYPLVVFKQLQDQGHKPVFTMKPAQPHKPLTGGSFI